MQIISATNDLNLMLVVQFMCLNDGITKFMPLSITVSPGRKSIEKEAEGFQNADEASEFAFTVEPARAVPRFDAPCSKTWKPAPKLAHAPNNAHNAEVCFIMAII